jgi:hypothetical protein
LLPQNFAEAFEEHTHDDGEVREQVAQKAHVSREQVRNVAYINQHTDDELKERLRNDEISVHVAYTELKRKEKAQKREQPGGQPPAVALLNGLLTTKRSGDRP